MRTRTWIKLMGALCVFAVTALPTSIGASIKTRAPGVAEELPGGGQPPSVRVRSEPDSWTFRDEEFRLTFPRGWSKVRCSLDLEAARSVCFADQSGSYFAVAIDPIGTCAHGDSLWRVKKQSGGLRVVSRHGCGPFCSKLNRQVAIAALWVKLGSVPFGDHYYAFELGGRRGGGLVPTLEAILESFRWTGQR